MNIQIKTIGGTLIFEGDFSCIAEAVSAAIKKGLSLRYANLRYADLSSADLRSANLSSADLRSANLRSANLSYANLSHADLSYANLSHADLSHADLSYAKNAKLAIAMTRILPEGEIVGWKKLKEGFIAKLIIPADAKRSHAFGRKCRAEFAKCVEIWDGKKNAKQGTSNYNATVIYRPGETVKADKWDDDFINECSNGIHFFITREEAEAYEF